MTESTLALVGLDGSNPLAFLAALGTHRVAKSVCPDTTMHWEASTGYFHPVLTGLGADSGEAAEAITAKLQELSTDVFEVNPRLPFDADEFANFLREASDSADRRAADFGCAYGSEAVRDEKKNTFDDTAFRMVRSGDSAGNGLLAYAARVRRETDVEDIRRTLFARWDYADGPPEYRWDPAGEKPYAYDWGDPSKSPARTMLGANSLALEALPLFPTVPDGRRVATTGFHRRDRRVYFTWPVWSPPIGVEVVRSLLAHHTFTKHKPDQTQLTAMGITSVFRSRRFASSQYYSNFSPAESV